jgi:hypothetical protein
MTQQVDGLSGGAFNSQHERLLLDDDLKGDQHANRNVNPHWIEQSRSRCL